MCFGFLWSDGADEVGVSDLSAFGNFGARDEEHGAGSFNFLGVGAVFADAAGEEASEFVAEAAFPDVGVWSFE